MSRALFLSASFSISASTAIAANGPVSTASRIEKAREIVLKGDRSGAMKVFKEHYREASPAGKNAAKARETSKEIAQSWKEAAEVFLTDKGQNQASLAESFWMMRPKDSVDLLLPLLKMEDGNLTVARLGARSALRAFDCAKADLFTQQAEATYGIGAEVKLLRLQVQDCFNGINANAPALNPLGALLTDADWVDLQPAVRVLQMKDSFRRKDLKEARAVLAAWDTVSSSPAHENPEYWYWKWRLSSETARDRAAARKYLRLCNEMTPRRRKNFVMHSELCLHTETVESDLKSSDKSGL